MDCTICLRSDVSKNHSKCTQCTCVVCSDCVDDVKRSQWMYECPQCTRRIPPPRWPPHYHFVAVVVIVATLAAAYPIGRFVSGTPDVVFAFGTGILVLTGCYITTLLLFALCVCVKAATSSSGAPPSSQDQAPFLAAQF